MKARLNSESEWNESETLESSDSEQNESETQLD